MQPYTLPKIKLPDFVEPPSSPEKTKELEERRPNRCSLDSLPLELLREIVKQVAPRLVLDTQRTLARLVMVNKQLRFLLLDDARKTMWIYSAEQVEKDDRIPQACFDSATTLIVTNELLSYWLRWYPDVLFDSDTVSFPNLRTLRLGVTYITQCGAGSEIPYVSLRLLQQLEAVQLGIGSPDTDKFLTLPDCYLGTSTPVLLDITSTWPKNLAKQSYQLQQFEYIQLRRLDPVNASAIYRALVDSPRLRLLFVAQAFVEEYAQRDKPDKLIKTLWRLRNKLKLKGGEVILCGPDDDELILPEFLDYLKRHKDKGRA